MHLCAYLTEFLLINTGNRQSRLILLNTSLGRQTLGLCVDAFGQRKLNRMRITESENDFAALHVGLITDSDHIHLFAEALSNSLNGVVGQRARQAMEGRLLVRSTLGDQRLTFYFEGNAVWNRCLEHTLRALYFQLTAVDCDGNPFGNRDRFLTNARHKIISTMLVNFRQQFSADVFSPRCLSTHQPTRGRDDVNAIAAQHARDLMRADIHAPSGTRHARQIRDRGSAARVVTQENTHYLLYAFALNDEVIDVAFLFEDARNF